MNWPAFKTCCDLLRHDARPAERAASWQEVIAVASQHMVLPALARPLLAGSDGPPEVMEFFSAVRALNALRNADLLDTLSEVIALLRTAGLSPVILKGAASLVTQLYEHPGERLVGDIDVLLPAHDVAKAAACLDGAGFTAPATARRWIRPRSDRHLPIRLAPQSAFGVELHHRLVRHAEEDLVETGDVIARAGLTVFGGTDLLVPSPVDRIIHNIVHDQMQHQHYKRGTTELRQLYELSRFCSRYGSDIDWSRIKKRFAKVGLSDVLFKQVALCTTLLGVEIPIAPRRGTEVVDRLVAALSRKASPSKFRRLWDVYAPAFIDNPTLALNLLDPRSWPGRIKTIRDLMTAR